MPTEHYRQLIRYAEDLGTMFSESREKDRALEDSKHQLLKFAEDLSETFTDLKRVHSDMQSAYLDTIHRLSLAAEYKDEDTGEHIIRMSRYSELLATRMGLSEKAVEQIRYASPMHDIGKIGIPDAILIKKGKLTDDEFSVIKTHPTIGGDILAGSRSEILQVAETIARAHHEKWNGTGYPAGLAGEDIPLAGRIVAVADVFDALTSRRPYKEPFPMQKAVDILKKDSGAHFDPQVVAAFLDSLDAVAAIMADSWDGGIQAAQTASVNPAAQERTAS